LKASRYAVNLYERLKQADPGQYADDVARVQTNIGMALSGLNRLEEALAAGQRAAAAYKRLAATDPESEPLYATALLNVGGMTARRSSLPRRRSTYAAGSLRAIRCSTGRSSPPP
jgi:hypothetical protein